MSVDFTAASTEVFSAIIRNDADPWGTPATRIESPRRGRPLAKWVRDIETALARKGIHSCDIERCRSAILDHAHYAEMTR